VIAPVDSIFRKRRISEFLRGAGKMVYNRLTIKPVLEPRVPKTSPIRRGLKHISEARSWLVMSARSKDFPD
jgi:hypothetical protein